MMKHCDMKASISLPSADPDNSDSIADDNREDSCVTHERMLESHLTDQEVIITLKLQIAGQQEMLDILSLKLSQCQVEINALKAKNAVLIDKRAQAGAPPVRSKGRLSTSECRGSMQMLISANAKFMTDNSRLQVKGDVLRASFHSYIKDSRKIVTALQQENEELQQILQDDNEAEKKLLKELLLCPPDPSKTGKRLSAVTSLTALSDISYLDDGNEMQSKCVLEWLQDQTQSVHVESDDGIQGKIKKRTEGARKSQDLLVDFGETVRPTKTSTSLTRSMPLICGTSQEFDGILSEIKSRSGGGRESQDLLVDFGETLRPTRTSANLSRSMPLICGISQELLEVSKMRLSFT
jgi:hypothetical protein